MSLSTVARYRAHPVKSRWWMTAPTTMDASPWVDRFSARRPLGFCPQCRNGAHQKRLGDCAGGQDSQKTQRQARARNEETSRGRAQGSESTAAHEHLHGAAAGKSSGFGAIAGCRTVGVGRIARPIEEAPQFLARRGEPGENFSLG